MKSPGFVRHLLALVVLAGLVAALAGCGATPAPTATSAPTATVAVEAATATSVPTATTAPTATVSPTSTATEAAAAEIPTVAAEATPAIAGTDLAGHWEGSLSVAGQELVIILDFEWTGEGYYGLMDIPQQSATDIPLANISYDAPAAFFEAFSGDRLATFDGELDGDTLAGAFTQAGYEGTFEAKRVAVAEEEAKPYTEEEVTFSSADASLAGTLSIPAGEGPFPAVVLISGSGQQNRDEDVMGFKVFGLLADYLTRHGIAVLRYDDRGIGGSTGDVEQATSEDFALDALAAVEYLLTRGEVRPDAIGLIGHSEGGIIAPMVANQSEDVAFVVLLAAPATTGAQVIQEQTRLILAANGASEEEISVAATQQAKAMDQVRSDEGWDQYQADLELVVRATVEALPTEERGTLGDSVDEIVANAVEPQIETLRSPWFRFFVTYDPVPALKQLDVPVMALFGGKDLQVPAGSNSPAMIDALQGGATPDSYISTLPDANHLFQQAETGNPNEYGTIKEFAFGFLDEVTDWILQRTEPSA